MAKKWKTTKGTAWQQQIKIDERMPRRAGESAAEYSLRWSKTYRGTDGSGRTSNGKPNTNSQHNNQN